ADTQPEDNPFEVKTAEQKPATPEVKTADVTQEETKQPAEEAPAARRPILTASSEEDTTRKTAPKYEEKLQKIAARDGMTGLKGFCPVALRDRRDLVDA